MELKFILEAILFNSQKPMSASELRSFLTATAANSEVPETKPFKKTSVEDIATALEQLEKEHTSSLRSFRLTCVAGSWQFVSSPEYAPWIRTMVGEKARPPRLSQPALETMAIIAYRQPLTRAEMEQIRGVSVDGVLQTLVERGLVEAVGRADVVGRPMTYGTTMAFLEYFGLRSLEELPAADELRRIAVKKPDALVTTEPEPEPAAPTAEATAAPGSGVEQRTASSEPSPLPVDAPAPPSTEEESGHSDGNS